MLDQKPADDADMQQADAEVSKVFSGVAVSDVNLMYKYYHL